MTLHVPVYGPDATVHDTITGVPGSFDAVCAALDGLTEDGERFKNYYVPESTGIATGFLIAALHHAGLYALTHTPNPMKFLTELCGRPDHEKPIMILAVGHAAEDATVPAVAKMKKPLAEILSVNPDPEGT